MKLVAAAIFISISTAIALGQQSTASIVTPEMRQAANELYQKKDWQEAASAYQKILAVEDTNLNARYRLGVIQLSLKQNVEALANLERVFKASPNAIFALALARAYSRLGSRGQMYETLESSLRLGGIAPESLTAETDFGPVRGEARFKDIVARSDLAVNPCKAAPEFRQLDFWIGEWDAKNAQGVTVGSSSIQLILGQCVIFENWSTPLNNGKSLNVFDTTDRKWHQTWVDDKGTLTHYVGSLVDGKMVYTADVSAAGKPSIARMTFSKLQNGDVLQFGENSADGGKTWTTAFQFTYTPKK
jgi:tetratricopeptide (TPR) repeat protein